MSDRVYYFVHLSKEAFVEFANALPPQSRFVNVEQWGFNHFWFYSPSGDALIFTPEEITKLE
jgi:hypothetical protein